jgi:DNA-binding transcriptional LysR family regulator
MDRLDSIKSFVRVVETGSFSAVAREQDTTQPTISKQIAALEEYLDVQLLTRSTRQLHLTEDGERFFAHCQPLLEIWAETESSVGQRQKPSGTLRVSCPVTFGQYQIVPRLKGFLERYPATKLDLRMSDRFINLVEEEVDLAIRSGQVQDPSLITQRIGSTRLITIGSASYFEHRKEPKTPDDLVHHNCIVYTPRTTRNEWRFQKPNGSSLNVVINGNIQVDNSTAVREAVLSGLGIALCPVWLFGELIHSNVRKVILPEYESPPAPIQAVYRRGRFIPAKVRCFIDYLTHEFKLDPWIAG